MFARYYILAKGAHHKYVATIVFRVAFAVVVQAVGPEVRAIGRDGCAGPSKACICAMLPIMNSDALERFEGFDKECAGLQTEL